MKKKKHKFPPCHSSRPCALVSPERPALVVVKLVQVAKLVSSDKRESFVSPDCGFGWLVCIRLERAALCVPGNLFQIIGLEQTRLNRRGLVLFFGIPIFILRPDGWSCGSSASRRVFIQRKTIRVGRKHDRPISRLNALFRSCQFHRFAFTAC